MTFRRSIVRFLTVVVGGLIGWSTIGPSLVDRWVLTEEPGSNHYSDYLFARGASMACGALVGAVAGFVIAVAATSLAVRRAGRRN